MEDDITDQVFTGTLENLPKLQSTIVRVFLSSTFTDFQSERNWLMNHAVPKLRKYCHKKGLDFQVSDMRWGVREDVTDDHKIIQLCIHEIKVCQRVSRGPNYVTFLGDKYGFRPLPAEIEATEFKLIKNAAIKLGFNTSLLLSWYLCDYNREPTMYSLQPISAILPHYFDMSPCSTKSRQMAQAHWQDTVDRLTSLLRKTSDYLYTNKKLSAEARHKYFQSVTEAEVGQGILNVPDAVNNKVICFARHLTDIDTKEAIAGRWVDLKDGQLDSQAQDLRERLLLQKIPDVLPNEQIFDYSITWDPIGVNITDNEEHKVYVEEIGHDFMKTLRTMVDTEMTESYAQRYRTPLFEEILHHLLLCKTKNATFCGREALLADVSSCLSVVLENTDDTVEEKTVTGDAEPTDTTAPVKKPKGLKREYTQLRRMLRKSAVKLVLGDSDGDFESDPSFDPFKEYTELPAISKYRRPVLITGKSGSGKTALMAKIADLSKTWFPGAMTVVRFMGTSALSSTIREVLLSMCMQIQKIYKVAHPVGIDFEADYQTLVLYFTSLLWRIDYTDRPLVIVLDSVDQLNVMDHAHMFNWLPHKLPTGVHMVVSFVTDRTCCYKNINQVFPHHEQYVEIDSLTNQNAVDIINTFCKTSDRHLSRKQKNLLLDLFISCSQPLYLKLLLDMSLSWKSYTAVDKKALGTTVYQAIHHLFDTLEKSHGEEMVRKGFGYMCAARDGLTVAELEDVLSLDDGVLKDSYIYHLPPDPNVIRLPPLLWKRLQYDIDEYIVERQSCGKTVIGWYHRQFTEVANERYLLENKSKLLHVLLAEYFQGLWSNRCKGLELTKGKRGSYPNAMRNVPEQPIKFGKNLYNTRKLRELPFHLIYSDQFEALFTHLFCDPEWLYAKCLTQTLTAVVADFRLAEEQCSNFIMLKKMYVTSVEKLGKRVNPNDVATLELATQIHEGIRLMFKMVLLAAESIRKDPVNLPLMLLSQFGPDYRGSRYIEQFVRRCQKWVEDFPMPLLIPVRDCMAKHSSGHLYSMIVDVTKTGVPQDDSSRSAYLHSDLNQLYVIEKRAGLKPDRICIFDIKDNGSCVATESIGKSIKSISFVGNNRYMLLEVYTSPGEGPSAASEHRLYDSSTAIPVEFDHPTRIISVSSQGKYIACSQDNSVHVYRKDRSLRCHQKIDDHKHDVTAILISPDESYLVTSDLSDSYWNKDNEGACLLVHDVKKKKKLFIGPDSMNVKSGSVITKSNLLVCSGRPRSSDDMKGVMMIYNLATGEMKHEVLVNAVYPLEQLYLHNSQNYVLTDFKSTTVINGVNNKYACMINIREGKMVGKAPARYIGPYKCSAVFGNNNIYYAVCRWEENDVFILYAGPVDNPMDEAVAIHVLTGHTQPVKEICIHPNLELMMTAGLDNKVKAWDLKRILDFFMIDLSRLEKEARQRALQQGIASPKAAVALENLLAPYTPVNFDHSPATVELALNRAGNYVYVGTQESQLQVYDVHTGKCTLTIEHSVGPVMKLILSRDGRYIIAAGANEVHIEDLQSQTQLCLEAKGTISCIAEANHVLMVGTCQSSGMAAKGRVWNIETGEKLKDLEFENTLETIAIDSTGTKIVSALNDFPVVIDIHDTDRAQKQTEAIDTTMAGAICAAISHDDKLAAVSSTDGAVRVIEMTGQYKFRLQQKSSAVNLAFSKDNQNLVSAGYRTIYVWSTTDGSFRYKLTRHVDFVSHMKFDETGRFLLTVSKDKQLIIWDFARAVSVATFQTNCQVKAIDITPGCGTVAYIPEGISDLAILKPNKALEDVVAWRFKPLDLAPQTQAVALAFSPQRYNPGNSSQACSIM